MKDEPMSLSPQVPPPGFEPHFRQSRLTDPWEPLFSRRLAGEAIILGLQAGEQHANSRGFVHGGLIASLADNAMGLSCHEHLKDAAPAGLVTVSLGIDYLGIARVGQWLEFSTSFVKAGRSLCFAQAFVTADGKPCARANATFSVPAA
jgi:uncharacterized protein (TIGR00369 family)